ncbi:MAG: inverse autotransporter beta domain-containing protein [Ferrovibrio sp.]|nr:inverse autotransporter beta domain-containing protein [Ferrovibrio sp.]
MKYPAGITAALFVFASMPALAQDLKWGPHIDLEAKPGSKRSLGEADLFVPLLQNADTLLFGSVRARMDDQESSEGNYGLGLRHMLNAGWNLGAYGYFDRRRTEYGHHFHQATFGLEALSQDWDLRANYYAPIGRRSHQIDSLNAASISGATVVVRGGEERSLGGFDAEIGWRVPLFDAKAEQQFRVYGGGYRFSESGVPDISGPRARIELTFDSIPALWEGSRFSLGAEWQHDEPRGSQGFLTARLRIPLQVYGKPAARLTPMERRMADPVVRDVDVVTRAGSFGAPEVATQTTGGQTLAVVNSSLTAGTALAGEVTTAGANSTVILVGSFNTGTNAVTLNSGQTVMGAGTLGVRTATGRTASLTTASATINGQVAAGVAAAVSMGSNSTLSGMTVTNTTAGGSGASGVVIDGGVSGATIANSTLTGISNGFDAAGILLLNGTNITIRNNTITGTSNGGTNAIGLNVSPTAASSALLAGNTVSASGGTTNLHTAVVSNTGAVTILGGSTGNVIGSGTCFSSGGSTTGSISYNGGSTCP